MKPHSWLSWCISCFAQGKRNNWMSKYLPAPLLGKSGHDLHHLWKNSSNREEPCGKHAEHASHMRQQDQPAPLRYSVWEHPKCPEDPALSSSLVSSPTSLLLLIGLLSHTLSFPQIPNCLLFFFVTALAQFGELPSSLYIPVTSQMSPLQRDLPKLCSPGSSRTHVLSPQSVMFFPQSHKNNSLSPETGFIYLAQII